MVDPDTYPARLAAARSRLQAGIDRAYEAESAHDIRGRLSAEARSYSANIQGHSGLSSADRAIIAQERSVADALGRLRQSRGKRYDSCRFDNYEISHAGQRETVDRLLAYAAYPANIATGAGVVLFGPVGTGKDHLLMALAFEIAKQQGIGTVWRNGCDLHTELKRTDFDGTATKDDLAGCPILWVSDPLPPTGALSDYQQRLFFGLVDARYSAMRPTWVSMNVANKTEAEIRMGAQVVDRLCHTAIVVPCSWPSYRTQRGRD